MAEKDVTEKLLEDYNDVFADIVNVLLFGGKRIIQPDELSSRKPRSAYKADGRLRELERDVMKEWVQNHIRIACLGLENQTNPDPYMALRTMGYDGQEYSTQLKDLKRGQKPAPVVTLVLYFGYKNRWNAPKTLIEALNVPEMFRPYVTDAKINLFEIAWLSREQVNLFQSDFRVVADYFVQMRENRDYALSRILEMPYITCHEPAATFLLFPDISATGMDSQSFVDHLDRCYDLALVPGTPKFFGPGAAGHIRICLATSHEILVEGMNRLETGLRNIQNGISDRT